MQASSVRIQTKPTGSGVRTGQNAVFKGAKSRRLPKVAFPQVSRVLGWTAVVLAVGLAFQIIKPFALALLGKNHSLELGGDQPDASGSAYHDQYRRYQMNRYIMQNYLMKGDGKIDWLELADISDVIARNTTSDHDFRRDLWSVVGWDRNNQRVPFASILDVTNAGLNPVYFNGDRQGNELYPQEQMHHYLGAVTGNIERIPSHLLQNPAWAFLYELKEWRKNGRFNWGDVRLTLRALRDRNAFLSQGRHVVGQNIRRLIVNG